MAKNDFLAKQRAMQQGFLEVGEMFGIQKMWDYLQLVLHDPNVMGKDTFGQERLKKVYEAMKALTEEYSKAFTTDKEADYYQEKMDRKLREIWGDKTLPFYERYPDLKKVKYDKPKKGWID